MKKAVASELCADLDVRTVCAGGVTELYLTARPRSSGPAADQAAALFAAVAAALRQAGAAILQERVLGTAAGLAAARPARAAQYAELADSVCPAWLAVPPGPDGDLHGVQVHALVTRQRPQVLSVDGRPWGRVLTVGAERYVLLSGLVAPKAGDACAQARAIFELAEAAIRQAGGTLDNVVRTWFWLGDILSWYTPFNGVRTRFFHERGLLNGALRTHMPASTGIGITPAGGALVGLDVLALIGPATAKIDYLAAAGKQRSPLEYGSAFSRAARAPMPAGPAVFVSGTAAIDPAGRSLAIDDARAQIQLTLHHVRAVLGQMGCTDADVVHALAYAKTPAVEAVFREIAPELPWPYVSVLADVCRPELLFEVEVTAAPGAQRR